MIKNWNVQLAKKYEPKLIKSGKWFSLSEKINGVRGIFYDGKIYSRQGKEITGLEHILIAINELNKQGFENMVFDGELVYKNSSNISNNECFRQTCGILNSKNANKNDIYFVIFDILPKDEFENGKSKLKYRERLQILEKMKPILKIPLDLVFNYYQGSDQNKIKDCFIQIQNLDREGIVINLDRIYESKRNTGVLKLKKFNTVDLKIVDFEAGNGKISNRLGSFIVDYKGSKLRVGTGFTDEERAKFWNKRESLRNRVIEVKFFAESQNKKDDNKSLQFPSFVRLRELEKAVSYD